MGGPVFVGMDAQVGNVDHDRRETLRDQADERTRSLCRCCDRIELNAGGNDLAMVVVGMVSG
jgi:hypothetical protein